MRSLVVCECHEAEAMRGLLALMRRERWTTGLLQELARYGTNGEVLTPESLDRTIEISKQQFESERETAREFVKMYGVGALEAK
jgi:hypothetical protein